MTLLRLLSPLILLALACHALPLGKYELFDYQPVANDSAVVVEGNARFTVLTDRVRALRLLTSRSCS